VKEESVVLELVEATCLAFMNSFLKYGPRSLNTTTRTIVMFILDFLKGYDVPKQQAIMQKVASHELIIDVMPPYLQNGKRLKHNHQLLENLSLDCQIMCRVHDLLS
jgi:hypothetical protein